MRTFLFCLLLTAGVLLIVVGLRAGSPIGQGLSRFFTCSAADRTIWLLVGGMLSITGAAAGLLRDAKPTVDPDRKHP